MAATNKREYRMSPFGEAVHPWINKADEKFSPENPLFKTGIKCSGPAAIKFMEELKEAAEASHASQTADMTPAERKKWSVYYPFEELENDEGEKTGEIVFHFKQNQKIKLKSGEIKVIQLRIQDGAGKDSTKAIFGGSTIRTMYAPRDNKMPSTKQFGVRLDFCGVQYTKLGTGSSGGGFGKVDGWEDDGSGEEQGGFPQSTNGGDAAAASGDY